MTHFEDTLVINVPVEKVDEVTTCTSSAEWCRSGTTPTAGESASAASVLAALV